MELKELYKHTKERMDKTLKSLRTEYDSIRVGRANAKVLDRIEAEYYGTMTPITQMAGISNQDARTLVITPWDKSALTPICKAIQTSDLGINPQNDGSVIRLTFPALTEERRKQLSKDVSKKAEEAKIAIRQIRRDSIDDIKAMEKKSDISEDDRADGEKEIQKITDDYSLKIDKISEEKTDEIMEI